MKIFVTGGTGFIGKAVVNQLLKENHSLLLLSRNIKDTKKSNIEIVRGDLSNISNWQKKLEKFKPDAAIHLAWEGLPDHNATLSRLNLEYSLNLTELLSENGCKRLIITGSCWEYGPQTGKLSEDTPPKPFDAFTAAKLSLLWLGQEIAKEKNMEFIWTRPFYVYGPGQHSKSLIPYLISCAQAGKKPEIRNPDAQNDFIFVEDVADALSQISTSTLKNNIYNIGSGKLTSISFIIKCIFDQFGIESDYEKASAQHKDELKQFFADSSRIRKEIGWSPSTDIKEGIIKTINYYKSLQ
jgi:dTDP-6-deoxy-L-talose 4-dehydrogenase (NAD+)